MLLDCETRWGSVYTMLKGALLQKQVVEFEEVDPDLPIVAESKVTPSDWDLIPKVIALLGPINAASKAAESDTASVADIITSTKKMKIELSQVSQSGIRATKDALLSQIHRCLAGGDSRTNFSSMLKNIR